MIDDPVLSTQVNEKLFPTTHTTPEEQQKYLNTYSFGALVLSFFYYQAMRDKLLMWLSVIVSLVFFLTPLLFLFPLWARRRAYSSRAWQNFGEFEDVQAKWDRAGVYFLISSLLGLYLLFRLVAPLLLSGLEQISPTLSPGSSGSNTLQQLQQTRDQLQQTINP